MHRKSHPGDRRLSPFMVMGVAPKPTTRYPLRSSIRRTTAGFESNLVRIALGLEDVEDLISDLRQALDRILLISEILSTVV
jgi:O-acetylhomoserine/O-acetylserine sulfhydrylase-like pyridoxal-dependent enzyme